MAIRMAIAACLMLALAAPARAADPFAQPVKDCRPCRFSPGPGQPEFALTFVFQGSGDQRALRALDIAAPDGAVQHLAVGPLAVSDFPDGFTLDPSDINFDHLGDLSIVTLQAADNTDAEYWVYQPKTRRFAALERVGDDGSDVTLAPWKDHLLVSHVRASAIEYTDFTYRIAGRRAVVIGTDSRTAGKVWIEDVTTDLTVTPPRVTHRAIVGFSSDSPARNAFLAQMAAASAHARTLYRHGDAAGAAAAIAAVVGKKELGLLTTSYPVQGDAGDLRLVGQFNDYGFYLEQAKRFNDAVGVLSQVTDVDAGRIVAYLNLADAEFALGQKKDAAANYAEYRKRMVKAGKQALIPARVGARLAS
ncbi:MAG: hypothetical protein KGL12_00560 [Rhodospirillales bacterium]|nr:hypothetical protein [Rhodospirillales bacterium]